jgi:hypothetical protein
MASVENVKEIIKALCTELQTGFSEPRNAQECMDLTNAIMQNAFMMFSKDSVVQSTIGVETAQGFRLSLTYQAPKDEDENEEESEEYP